MNLTQSQFKQRENFVLASNDDVLEIFFNKSSPNWAGKFCGYFNAVFFSRKTWKSFKKEVDRLIESYNLTITQ